MYLVFLGFGGLSILAGVALTASGLSIHDQVFDTAVATPGAVAIVGGTLIMVVALALRRLQRIELALVLRPTALAARAAESGEAAGVTSPAQAATLEKAAVADQATRTQIAVMPIPPSPSITTAVAEQSDEEVGEVVPFDKPRVAAENEAAYVPRQSSVDDAVAEVERRREARRQVNANLTRSGMPADPRDRPQSVPARPKAPAFETLWPKSARSLRAARIASGAASTATAAAAVEEAASSAFEAEAEIAAVRTVLKSGVVDGMAYTLFSDGSIEAALPQGRLRFGSISELRQHLGQE
jgi:hypothetical protein